METIILNNLKENTRTMKESLRALKTNIQFCGDDIKSILITSSVPNEGKSTVTMDLARSLTESGKSVLVIDTDMRKSVLVGRLRAKAQHGEVAGLSHYLSGQKKMDEVLYATNNKRLFMVLPVVFRIILTNWTLKMMWMKLLRRICSIHPAISLRSRKIC